MEFLEATNFFVRVTVYDFHNKLESERLKFRLIPMLHIGEQKFYDLVGAKILECDELIYEGIQRKRGIQLINSREKISNELGLVMQRDALKFKDITVKLTHGDFTKEESNVEWKKVRLLEKLKDRITIPIEKYLMASTLTRMKLAKFFMKSYSENFLAFGPRFNEPGTTENFYYARREQKVFNIIAKRITEESEADKLIGILYGAGHMNRISRNLIDMHGYHPANGQFIKVFDIN